MSLKTRPMSADEFLALPDDGLRHELIRGEVLTMPLPGGRHGAIAMEIAWQLNSHVKLRGLGRIYAAETGFLIERNPDTVRGADVAFVRSERLPLIVQPDKHVPFAPDLAVEVVSPSDRPAEIRDKVRAWLAAGAHAVWVVAVKDRSVTVHRPGADPLTLGPDDAIDGEDVLPGFRSPVRTLFD